LSQEKIKQEKIAEILDKTQGWVSQILSKFQKEGYEGLKEKKAKGALSKLNATQKEELRSIINKGAEVYGFEGNLWNRKRVKLVIEESFVVIYSERQADRIVKGMGYTIQKPKKVDYRQNEDNIRQWKEKELPEMKKKRKKKIE
jgi:transposase